MAETVTRTGRIALWPCSLGEGVPEQARFEGWAIVGLGLATVGGIGVVLAVFVPQFVAIFTDDPETVDHAIAFARTYGLGASVLVADIVIAGSLQGAGYVYSGWAGKAARLMEERGTLSDD